MRYRVRLIADANCGRLTDVVLGEFDNLQGAEYRAETCDHSCGAAIEDTQTGLIDFGQGFVVKDEVN